MGWIRSGVVDQLMSDTEEVPQITRQTKTYLGEYEEEYDQNEFQPDQNISYMNEVNNVPQEPHQEEYYTPSETSNVEDEFVDDDSNDAIDIGKYGTRVTTRSDYASGLKLQPVRRKHMMPDIETRYQSRRYRSRQPQWNAPFKFKPQRKLKHVDPPIELESPRKPDPKLNFDIGDSNILKSVGSSLFKLKALDINEVTKIKKLPKSNVTSKLNSVNLSKNKNKDKSDVSRNVTNILEGVTKSTKSIKKIKVK